MARSSPRHELLPLCKTLTIHDDGFVLAPTSYFNCFLGNYDFAPVSQASKCCREAIAEWMGELSTTERIELRDYYKQQTVSAVAKQQVARPITPCVEWNILPDEERCRELDLSARLSPIPAGISDSRHMLVCLMFPRMKRYSFRRSVSSCNPCAPHQITGFLADPETGECKQQ